MPRILILAYYFPPLGMGGTQRIAKLVKYLPKLGWQPTVITVKDIKYYAKDDSFLQDIQTTRVIRAGSLEPQRLAAIIQPGFKDTVTDQAPKIGSFRVIKWSQKVMSWLFVPDSKILWLPFATLRAFFEARKVRFAAVLTTSPPHSSHFAGWLLKTWLKLPWLADFRDGWSQGEFQHEPTHWHQWLNRHLEAFILTRADAIVTVSDGLSKRFAHQRAGKSHPVTITNGFDQEDLFKAIPVSKKKPIRICHCGAVSDINDPSLFLHALKELLDEKTELKDKIEAVFVGAILKPSAANLVKSLELTKNVEFTGNLTHPFALGYILSADLLLLIISGAASSAFIPGKVFEYLAGQKNILALIPDGETARLLQGNKKVCFANPGDLKCVKNALKSCLENISKNQVLQNETKYLVQFERKFLIKKYVTVLNSIMKKKGKDGNGDHS